MTDYGLPFASLENDAVVLKSPIDASGQHKEITVRLDGNMAGLRRRLSGDIEMRTKYQKAIISINMNGE